MRSKNKIIIIGTLLITLIIFSLVCLCIPTIKIDLNGEKYITLALGEEYIENGAESYFSSINKKVKLHSTISGIVNTSKTGKYIITYEANYKDISRSAIRIINVVDNKKPKIILNNEIKVCKKNNLIEIDATAADNYDGDITDSIKYQLKNNKVLITVTDSSNNKAELKQDIKYIDEEKPTITLNGSEVIYLYVGDTYEELGATAYDSCDGNITDKLEINNNINNLIAGTYQVSYQVTDSVGQKSEIIRTIVVKTKEETIEEEYPVINGATIYLTFDDGPNQYTEKILEILDKYNIKATFFVTNQFPEYQHVIKQEYESGHTIGIHTYSHKWSIYTSVETYLDDFYKIDNIIYEQTGIHTKIFRFPGGSSNKVSTNYKKGIMTELSKVMTEKGYIYFDWTFDSGDTNKKDNSTQTIINNVKRNLKGDGEYIVLMHDIKKNTLEALPFIIEYAKSKGYDFAAINGSTPIKHFKIAN